MLSDFTTLTFDCYGTLIDWEKGILGELRPWAIRHGVIATDETLLDVFAGIESVCQQESPTARYPQILEEVLGRIARRYSVELDEGEGAEFGRSVGRWPAFPDSAEALRYLRGRYKLVILSNVDRESFAMSEERLGVTFDRVITAQDVGSYKPDIRNFKYLLDDLGQSLQVRPEQILHTAQSLYHDIVPAQSLGLRTMWINRRRGKDGWGATPKPDGSAEESTPDWEVGNMAEFAALHRSQTVRTMT
ncbi:MAG: haloacid dehalogenase type II [Gemmatimonas sp.]|nr:haloacid dehalogenase type II [Gemmatimonas sp.]